MKSGPIVMFMGFIAVCGAAAHYLHVDIYVVIEFISKALTGGK